MMKIPMYQVDAFTSSIFGGNPAAVCPLESWISDEEMQKIAIENNLAETAFFCEKEDGTFQIRWFTPEFEVDLCGHATLAGAHVIFKHLMYKGDRICFHSMSGELNVERNNDLILLDFPSRKPESAILKKEVLDAFTIQPKEVLRSRDYFLVYESEAQVLDLHVNASLLNPQDFGKGGIICTAVGKDVDFVSRFFLPGASVFEDPVTGSAHCSLIPFWADRLSKKKMEAKQISSRVGHLQCENQGSRVKIGGHAVTFLEGSITI